VVVPPACYPKPDGHATGMIQQKLPLSLRKSNWRCLDRSGATLEPGRKGKALMSKICYCGGGFISSCPLSVSALQVAKSQPPKSVSQTVLAIEFTKFSQLVLLVYITYSWICERNPQRWRFCCREFMVKAFIE
jgi:hypothetical protein